MAQKLVVSLQDDLDGSPAAETLHFALGGTEFEIDLNEQHADTFRQQISPFVEHARRAAFKIPSNRRDLSDACQVDRAPTAGVAVRVVGIAFWGVEPKPANNIR